MYLHGVFKPLFGSHEFKTIAENIEQGLAEQMVYGLSGSQKSYFLAGLANRLNHRPLLIITHEMQQAEKLYSDLSSFLPSMELSLFPHLEIVPYETITHSPETIAQRLQVLKKLVMHEAGIVIAPVEALLRKLIPPQVYKESCFWLATGQRVDLDSLFRRLIQLGYERTDMVENKGQFSVRGGIVDIFSFLEDEALRIEFFDDEIDSLRSFDPDTQRSSKNLAKAFIGPAREQIFTPEVLAAGEKRIRHEFETAHGQLLKLGKQEASQKLAARIGPYLEKLDEGIAGEETEHFLPYFYPELKTLLDFTPPDTLVVFDEPLREKEILDFREKELLNMHTALLEEGLALPSQVNAFLGFSELLQVRRGRQTLYLAVLPKKLANTEPKDMIGLSAKSIPAFHGQLNLLVQEIRDWRKRKYTVVILTSTEVQAKKLEEMLGEHKINAVVLTRPDQEILPEGVVITLGGLTAGFEFPKLKLVVISDAETFRRKKKARVRFFKEGSRLRSYQELNVNDYVVHINHGIGKYLGVKTLTIAGVQKDYLHIKYAGEDKLYVPTDQMGLLQKYVGTEDQPPKLYKLGGGEWNRIKTKVKESVQDLAKELLELYAARQTVQGHAFSPDTVWQREFEATFPYEETPDQIQAIMEVKRDMEAPRPMDRLLCGDVGYGKTEVAIRAAFKAVMDGKQVAVLVPTTILAQQHYNTFRERFAGFPVNIEMLSRFRSEAEQRTTLNNLARGVTDIVIGTHRLVQSDIKFKDLGLLIIDEEQRFGVAQKEKLKQLRTSVDVLTLTATPIPRTLHMSLVGVRDMSIIESPPEDRFPVQTYVVEYNTELIREAILRELNRGGQVYYVHNRVQTINQVVAQLRAILPDARIAVVHGQMDEEQLERTMLAFYEGEYDLLVCTTIIESGLDIPNVNTLIVDNADQLGLAQLYQLRGRVGRSNRLAYAYFTYRKDKLLSEVAEKRLTAIKEFTEFGSGFKIAMRDLEIRGAGNILGPEQHGHIAAVGFDLYTKMLAETINELKGEPVQEKPETILELQVDAYISDHYISDAKQKILVYKRLAAAENMEEIDDLEDELLDRFGDLPPAVSNLLEVARIRCLAQWLGIKSLVQDKDKIVIKLNPNPRVQGNQLYALTQEPAYRGKISFQIGKSPAMHLKVAGLNQRGLLRLILGALQRLSQLTGQTI